MGEESDMRQWSLDEEILLFDLMCDFKPAGHNKDKQMNIIVEKMNKSISEGTKAFTAQNIWTKLAGMYDLERVNELEDYMDEDDDTGEENEIQNDSKDNKEEIDAVNKESDSSGLSDVETDVPSDKEALEVPKSGSRGNNRNKKEKGRKVDLKEEGTDAEKDSEGTNEDGIDGDGNNEDGEEENDEDEEEEDEQNDENDESEGGEGSLPKRVTRGARKHHELSEQTGTPKSKKRTRSSAKLDAIETPPPSKRGQKASTPPAQQTPIASAKRRKKSEVQEPETEKSNTRRSTRSSVPATTPLKPQAPPIRRSSRKK